MGVDDYKMFFSLDPVFSLIQVLVLCWKTWKIQWEIMGSRLMASVVAAHRNRTQKKTNVYTVNKRLEDLKKASLSIY